MSTYYKFRGEKSTLVPEDKLFPQSLLEIPKPPKCLYVYGNPNALEEGISIVGARCASPYGLSAVKHFGSIASKLGLCIISGGAYGCDIEAHKTALSNHGKTVVFLGSGCNMPHPVKHIKIYQEIIDSGGAIVSEFPWDMPPLKSQFILRNRLIAALAKVTFVVEAGLPSGTFSTANYAIEYGKEVWTIPGSINFSGAMGCNKLIFDGATPIINDEIFLYLLNKTFGVKSSLLNNKPKVQYGKKLGFSGNPILEALMAEPMSTEALLNIAKQKCKKENPYSWLSKMLIEAENSGKICKYKDGRYGPVIS